MEPLLCIMKISDASNEGETINYKQESFQFNNHGTGVEEHLQHSGWT